MSDPPDAHISHRTPARLRVKVPSRKGDIAWMGRVVESFQELEGIDRIEANPATGSILFLSRRDPEDILEHAGAKGLFHIDRAGRANTPLFDEVKSGFTRLDRRVTGFTAGEVDLRSVAFLSLLAMGIYDVSLGNFMAPAWYTAFWYAMNLVPKADAHGSGK